MSKKSVASIGGPAIGSSARFIVLPKAACVALALLAATCVNAADNTAKPRVVAFNASVRVEVDAAGKPVKVEAPADLPEAIRGFIEKRVASWQYQPAKQNGVPGSATTFVQVGACAIPTPAGDAYKLGLDFKGNGPKIIAKGDRLPPPQYPIDAQIKGYEGTFMVSYAIQPDGSTRLQNVETLAGGNKLAKWFHPVLAKWIEQLRYEPEQVNGRPVATTMSFPVDFALDSRSGPMILAEWRKNYAAELQARAIASKECIAASAQSDGLQPLAQNSPVKITPIPAS